jgi:exosortase E/protease (VPEID-CTERM system)
MLIALTVVFANIAAVLSCYAFDIFGLFGNGNGLTCSSLGLTGRVCTAVGGGAVPRPLLLPLVVVSVIIALGLYDPRPLITRLEQSRRSPFWLVLNAAGVVIFISPYLFASAGTPLSLFASFSPYLLALGALLAGAGLFFWLFDRELAVTLKLHHVLVLALPIPAIYLARELQELGWGIPALQAATFKTAILLLNLSGESVESDPSQALIGIGRYRVIVESGCSGIAGMLMVSGVMAGYVLVQRNRLVIGRALLLLPLAAGLSWFFNAVRIAVLLTIGAYVSPELAGEGFHTNAGWLSFCALSAFMLVAAENFGWIHRTANTAVALVRPLRDDTVVAQIAPFTVLLVSLLLSGAIFIPPEAGYPLRAILMAASIFIFWGPYRAEIGSVNTLPVLTGGLIAIVWLGFRAGVAPLTVSQILGSASQGFVVFWVLCRIIGTALLVPFIEEMFFRGYLLRRLDFGGWPGKVVAIAISSILFGALHSDIVLASTSGVVFALILLRRGRIFDAVVSHATANGLIAVWALSTGDWAVI